MLIKGGDSTGHLSALQQRFPDTFKGHSQFLCPDFRIVCLCWDAHAGHKYLCRVCVDRMKAPKIETPRPGEIYVFPTEPSITGRKGVVTLLRAFIIPTALKYI